MNEHFSSAIEQTQVAQSPSQSISLHSQSISQHSQSISQHSQSISPGQSISSSSLPISPLIISPGYKCIDKKLDDGNRKTCKLYIKHNGCATSTIKKNCCLCGGGKSILIHPSTYPSLSQSTQSSTSYKWWIYGGIVIIVIIVIFIKFFYFKK